MMALCHVNHTNVNVCVIGMTVMSITQTLADKCLHEQHDTVSVFPSNSQRYQLNSFIVVIFLLARKKSNNYMLYTQYQSQVSYTDYFKWPACMKNNQVSFIMFSYILASYCEVCPSRGYSVSTCNQSHSKETLIWGQTNNWLVCSQSVLDKTTKKLKITYSMPFCCVPKLCEDTE